MKKLVIYALIPLAGALASCKHKDLIYDERQGDVRVVFDWQNAPDADPASMETYFYGSDDTYPLRFIFQNREGGIISIPGDNYVVLGKNSDDSDWACMRNLDDINCFETYTDDVENLQAYSLSTRAIPRAEGTENERIAKNPGTLWADRRDNVNVVYKEGEQIITLYPEEVTCHYYVDIYDVENIKYIEGTMIDGMISGMSEGYIHGRQSTADEHVTMPFTLDTDVEAAHLHGEFLTFGESANQPGTHILTIYLYLTDGSRWYYTFDVTGQVHEAPDPHHVYIRLTGLPLPKPIMAGGGMVPVVNDWQTENIDIKM